MARISDTERLIWEQRATITDLRARLAEVEAERDHYKYDFVMTSLENGQLQETMFASFEQCDELRARLAAVLALCDAGDPSSLREAFYIADVRAAAEDDDRG